MNEDRDFYDDVGNRFIMKLLSLLVRLEGNIFSGGLFLTMKKIIMTFCAFMMFTLAISTNEVFATTEIHHIKKGDTLYSLSERYNVPVAAIKKVNNLQSSALYEGETLKIPAAISPSEKELLARLVHAEAEGEPYEGKVAVAVVVLNRVDHPDFPNTVKEVIEEVTPSGHYAFSPVLDGRINNEASDEARRAVEEAIAFRGQGQGSIFFYNPKIATNHWQKTRTVTVEIGNHVFSK